AAEGAPYRISRVRPRVAARRPRRGRGLPANRRRAGLRRHARALSAELSRALLQELSQGGLPRHCRRLRPRAYPRRERLRLQSDGFRQAMKISKLRTSAAPRKRSFVAVGGCVAALNTAAPRP